VIDAVDIDVIHIQQQITICFLEHGRDELDLS